MRWRTTCCLAWRRRLEAEWASLQAETDELNAALLSRLAIARGPALEWGRLRRGVARVAGWLGRRDAVLADTSLPGAAPLVQASSTR